MKIINKLERKFGRYAIPNLTTYIIVGYIIGYALEFFELFTKISVLRWLTLNPYEIFHNGQIWRILPGSLRRRPISAYLRWLCCFSTSP